MLRQRLQPFNMNEEKFSHVYEKYNDDDEYKVFTGKQLGQNKLDHKQLSHNEQICKSFL